MKKNYLLAGLMSLGMLFIGCDRDGKDGKDSLFDPGLNGEMAEITPAKSKSRLQDIGVEFVNAINAESHENLANVLTYVESNLDFEVDEAYYEKLEGLVEESGGEEDYARGVNPVRAMVDMAASCLAVAQNGAQLASRTDDIYTFTLKAGLKDVYGGFTPDMSNGEWKYDGSINDRLEVTFTDDLDQVWVATLKGSKETTRVNLTYDDIHKWNSEYIGWDGNKEVYEEGGHERYIISIDVPKLITFVVTCGNEKVVNLEVNSSLALDIDYLDDYSSYQYEGYDDNREWYYMYGSESKIELKVDYSNLNLDAALDVNGYAESFVVKVSESNIKSSAEVKINGKSMLKAEAAVNGDIDAFIKEYNKYCSSSYSYSSTNNEEVHTEAELAPTCIKNFAVKLDVMGKSQIYGKCDSFEKFYNAYYLTEGEWDEMYGKYNEAEAWEKYIDAINDTYDITIHYDNTATVQANIEFEGIEIVEEDYYDTYTYYDVRPVLVFAADDSRYAFEDYFTESGFSKVFDAVEELAEELEDMFGQFAEEEEVYPY